MKLHLSKILLKE